MDQRDKEVAKGVVTRGALMVTSTGRRADGRANNLAQWMEVLAAKSDNLSSIPRK